MNKYAFILTFFLATPVYAAFFVTPAGVEKNITEVVDKSKVTSEVKIKNELPSECANIYPSDWLTYGTSKAVDKISYNDKDGFFEIKTKKGWDVFSASHGNKNDLYVGKVNNFHRIIASKNSSDGRIIVVFSNLKSEKSRIEFLPPKQCINAVRDAEQEKTTTPVITNQEKQEILSSYIENKTDAIQQNFDIKSALLQVQENPEIKSSVPLNLLKIAKGDRISDVTERIMNHYGYTSVWRTKDMVFDINLEIPASSASSVDVFLETVVAKSGFKYMIHNDNINRVVVITE